MKTGSDLGCLGEEFTVAAESRTGAKVLVVEDDSMLRRTLLTYLETKGFRPFSASSCAAAMRTLRALPAEYAVIVADLDIEGEDSMDLLRAAVERIDGPEVIYIANQLTQERVDTLRVLGAFETYEKPFVWKSLAEAVNRAALKGKQ